MKYLFAGMLFLVMMGCTTVEKDSERYEFENLESVDSIFDYRLDSWEVIDERSLVLETRPRKYYLVILFSPVPQLEHTLEIMVTSNAQRVRSGFDTVAASGDPMIKSPIYKIYKLTDKAQISEVREQIMAETE